MTRDSKSDVQNVDIERLQQLMELMEKHDVREMKVQQGSAKYFLRRGPQEVVSAAAAPLAFPPQAAAPPQQAAAPATTAPASDSADDAGLIEIVSPTIGTYYSSPSPEEPTFVKVGDHISSDTVVCIIEAMKVFNQIPAGCSGTISKALLKDGDPVEYGQVLFLVKPN